MFTGIVTAIGTVAEVCKSAGKMDLTVEIGGLEEPPTVGASIALSGVCCTVTQLSDDGARFHLSEETLSRTRLGSAAAGDSLNLEPALRAGDPFGGHMVQGHVDGLAEVVRAVGESGGELQVRLPEDLLPYCVEKGSIALDGVSLTIASLDADRLAIAVIPHTALHTTLGGHRPGDRLHVEVDVLAKYVERLLELRFQPRDP